MTIYICEKCNKEFNKKSNYITHINRKYSCNKIEEIKTIYKCEKCNKEFNRKFNYLNHINKQNECNNINLEDKYNNLELEFNKLKNINENIINKNILLENENKKLNELLDKYIKNSNNIITTNNTNNTQNNNTINITLTDFGKEDYNKLTNEEQLKILKSNKQCLTNLIKYLHVNNRFPERFSARLEKCDRIFLI
jgi:DNA-directed RNA polymerase subunit RPC12/RpoP